MQLTMKCMNFLSESVVFFNRIGRVMATPFRLENKLKDICIYASLLNGLINREMHLEFQL